MSVIAGVNFPMSYGIIPEVYMDIVFIHGNKLHGL